MPEQLDFTTPIATTRTSVSWTYLELNMGSQQIVAIGTGSDGQPVRAVWTGPPAMTLMTALNTANLSSISLMKRLYQQAVTDGKIPAGTVSGTPGL